MTGQKRKHIVIVSPALADANNGNWQTARRWQRMLSGAHSARITREWPGHIADIAAADHVMLALHARRSAPSIAAWAWHSGPEPIASEKNNRWLQARTPWLGGTDDITPHINARSKAGKSTDLYLAFANILIQ